MKLHNTTHKKAMIEALEKSLGIVTTACKSVGIERSTHYDWYKLDEDYRAAVDGISDIALDFAESKLHSSIANGSDTATIFYLKCKGKRRGFIERSEIDMGLQFGKRIFIDEEVVNDTNPTGE